MGLWESYIDVVYESGGESNANTPEIQKRFSAAVWLGFAWNRAQFYERRQFQLLPQPKNRAATKAAQTREQKNSLKNRFLEAV